MGKEYIYNIGDKINGYEIIEQTRTYYKKNIYGIKRTEEDPSKIYRFRIIIL